MTYCYDYPRPSVTTDIVVFRKINSELNILLIKRSNEPFKNFWALPGGFVDKNEALETAALRELKEETHLDSIELHQFHAFGNPGRDPRGHCVSIAYWGWLPEDAPPVIAGDDAALAAWFPTNNLPALAFDHSQIINMVLTQIET